MNIDWIEQPNQMSWIKILSRLTIKPSFNLRDEWERSKAKQKEADVKPKHGGQKNKKKEKKIDILKRQNQERLQKIKTNSDQHLLDVMNLSVDMSFSEYADLIRGMKTHESRLQLRQKILLHLCKLFEKKEEKDIDQENLNEMMKNMVDLYLVLKEGDGDDALLKRVEKILRKEKIDLIHYQLNQIANRIPPLTNLGNQVIRLDDWQKLLLKAVDDRRSAIICAPTSSGKTVISTYAATTGNKTLCILPTEPLALQVGGLYHDLLGGNVSIITNNYRLDVTQPLVIVGTPIAVEGELLDRPFTIEYAIFDEIHELGGQEGAAIERLIRQINCPYLFLSATIRNPEEIREWVSSLHPGTNPQMINYNQRFINLQRYLYFDSSHIEKIHPISTMSADDIANYDVDKYQSIFTANDCYTLWNYLSGTELDKRFDPSNYFGTQGRIKMSDCQRYEQEVRTALASLPDQKREEVVAAFDVSRKGQIFSSSPDQIPVKDLFNLLISLKDKNMIPCIAFQMNENYCEEMFKEMISFAEKTEAESLPYQTEMLNLKQTLFEEYEEKSKRREDKDSNDVKKDQPARGGRGQPDSAGNSKDQIEDARSAFHDRNLGNYKSAVVNFIDNRIQKVNRADDIDKPLKKKIILYLQQERREVLQMDSLSETDIWKAHRDFCFTKEYISDHDVREVKWIVQSEIKHRIKWESWVLRGIRRGIGIYIRGMSPVYKRMIQSLAIERKLAVIISDDSLAFGVNLPIKTVCLAGWRDSTEFEPLVAQQMFGRAGRRGIDTEGNIIFFNTDWKKILKGEYCRVTGRPQKDRLVPLYADYLNRRQMEKQAFPYLHRWIEGQRERGEVIPPSPKEESLDKSINRFILAIQDLDGVYHAHGLNFKKIVAALDKITGIKYTSSIALPKDLMLSLTLEDIRSLNLEVAIRDLEWLDKQARKDATKEFVLPQRHDVSISHLPIRVLHTLLQRHREDNLESSKVTKTGKTRRLVVEMTSGAPMYEKYLKKKSTEYSPLVISFPLDLSACKRLLRILVDTFDFGEETADKIIHAVNQNKLEEDWTERNDTQGKLMCIGEILRAMYRSWIGSKHLYTTAIVAAQLFENWILILAKKSDL